MNNKIVSTKKTSAVFLAIVLVAGTITAISPLFITGVNAQGDLYYGMDSYDDRKPYGMDDSYGASDYGIDNDRKSYDNSYKSQYQSYKPDYKPVKDDSRDKSKDSKVDINKLKCINTNLNINGENAGNVSIGNKGAAADGGYLGGGYSSDDGYGGETKNRYYDNGYNNNKDNGFDCVINNNNNNINIIAGDGGNATNGNVTACEECFFNITLNSMQLNRLLTAVQVTSIGEYCDLLASTPNSSQETQSVIRALDQAFASPIPPEQNRSINTIIECLIDARVIGPR